MVRDEALIAAIKKTPLPGQLLDLILKYYDEHPEEAEKARKGEME